MRGLSYYILFAGLWALVNGILHDVVILRQRRPFDRELIRLLIDGHVLIFGGILYLISFRGISTEQSFAFLVCMVAALFLLGYCFLIFKMLPSIATITINLIALVWLIIDFLSRSWNVIAQSCVLVCSLLFFPDKNEIFFTLQLSFRNFIFEYVLQISTITWWTKSSPSPLTLLWRFHLL